MITRILPMLSLLALLLAVAGCERRPLEVEVDGRVLVRVIVRWDVNYIPIYNETPNGMTVRIWDEQNNVVFDEMTHEDHVDIPLPVGHYRLAVYNEVASEYADYGMNFYDYNDFDAMTFRSRRYTRAQNALAEGVVHIVPPEYPRVAVATDAFEITKEMVLSETSYLIPYEDYEGSGYQGNREYDRIYEFIEEPWPMTVDLYVTLLVKHRDRLSRVEGSLSGMADGFHFTKVIRTTETASIWLDPSADKWRRARYTEDADQLGLLQARVACYGLPYGKEALDERNEKDNILSLRLTLVDGKAYDFVYDVGKLIRYIDPEGKVEQRIRYREDLRHLQLEVNLPDPIDLPEVDPTTDTGAGFDARVADWEDGGVIDMGGF
ncbi:MAG: DUF5119 domain-containing protein [Prevotella sp.]|nr:DUF5119 domain-containing protein [Prevotella sp.]MBQ9186294.1 DUF5119 domain-containing protein [Prevotella sp.]